MYGQGNFQVPRKKNGTPFPWEASHRLPINFQLWEWYGNGMGPASQKGVPFLGVPGNSLNTVDG